MAKKNLLLKLEDGRILYCIAFRYWSKGKQEWVAQLEYVHAFDGPQARVQFMAGIPMSVRPIEVDAIAPAVGVFVEDEKKGILSV